MADRTFAQNFVFFNILPFSPGEEEQLAREAAEYTERTGNRNVLYSLTLSPAGFPAMNKVLFMLESYRKLKAALQGTSCSLGVLFQAVLGHGARNFPPPDLKSRPVEPWVRMVNVEGALTRYCPLDPGFRKYIFDMSVLFAKEAPCFILGDDDIRSFAPKAECFCELHTAAFNRMTGKNYTSEEYRQAVLACKRGDEVYEAYETLRRGIPNGVASIIREAVDTVDPGIRCGSCMPGWEFLFNGETSKCFAGKHPAVMRVANANYNETSAKHYPWLVVKTMALRLAHKEIPVVLDESDTCPHNLWSRAAVSMHAKLVSGIFAGLNGAKLWYVNAHKGGKPVSRNYTDILAENKGLYQTLAAECAKTGLAGVVIPAHKNFADWHAAHYNEISRRIQLVAEDNMAVTMLGHIGVPFRASFEQDEDEVYAVSGAETIDHLSDEELKKLLSRKLLLDGPAAAAVSSRGFSDALGLTAEHRAFSFNRELRTDDGKGYTVKIEVTSDDLVKSVDLLNFLASTNYYAEAIGAAVSAGAGGGSSVMVGGSIAVMTFKNMINAAIGNNTVIDITRNTKQGAPADEDGSITVDAYSGSNTRIIAGACISIFRTSFLFSENRLTAAITAAPKRIIRK